jgi:hypothetical protein
MSHYKNICNICVSGVRSENFSFSREILSQSHTCEIEIICGNFHTRNLCRTRSKFPPNAKPLVTLLICHVTHPLNMQLWDDGDVSHLDKLTFNDTAAERAPELTNTYAE